MKELDPRIRIRAPLRCDGIGRLDCAEDTVSGERLAVQWLPLEANGDAAVKACEKLPAHPTLPRILQTGQVGTSAFVALDFPDGEMLSARGEERLDNELLIKLAAQLSDALATVHAQGVVHGEMSRDSVLLVKDGKASLWDMPLVIANRLSDRRGENRLMQNLVKTAPYLSPERAAGEGASQASDVYALGAILCVAGGAPLPTASSTLGAVHQVASGEWTPRVPQSLPERWRTMLEKMIARDPAARPTAMEVAMAFSHAPGQNSLPTVPELPALRLPPEILAAADALMKSQVDAMRAPTREVPLAQVEAAALAMVDVTPVAPTNALPMAVDPLPELNLNAAEPVVAPSPAPSFEAARTVTEEVPVVAAAVHPHTLDEVVEPTHDVVRIPTMEIKAIDAETAALGLVPVKDPPVERSVPLSDNVSVSPELHAAGAMMLSEDEVAAMHASSRQVWWLFGGIAVAALILIGVVVMLATRTPEVAPVAPVVAPPVQAEAPAPKQLDELEPLPKITPRKPVVRAAPAPVATEPAPAVAAPAPVEAAPAPVAETNDAADFSFLESAEAPKSELKRPTSEL